MPDATGGPEFAAIVRIATRLAALGPAPAGELWIGDDAAVVRVGTQAIVAAADALVAGVHTDLALTTIGDFGWKALAVNISDLAAMGCVATRALVTVSGPPDADIDGLYEGLAQAAEEFSCPVVGGDLTSAPVLVVSVSVLGDGAVTPPPVTRIGASAGDEVWVTGPLGAAAAGLRGLRTGAAPAAGLVRAYARPIPRVVEGVAARELGATAMIDVSDGFAADLGHILDGSGLGGSGLGVELDAIPVAAGATVLDAIEGGDDYELVWCAPRGGRILEGFRRRGLREPHLIGRCVADRGRRLLAGEELGAGGWTHPIGRANRDDPVSGSS